MKVPCHCYRSGPGPKLSTHMFKTVCNLLALHELIVDNDPVTVESMLGHFCSSNKIVNKHLGSVGRKPSSHRADRDQSRYIPQNQTQPANCELLHFKKGKWLVLLLYNINDMHEYINILHTSKSARL